ncbi:MAG: hypothetical protein PVG22_13310, partial [Chromatiales bacterium]
MRIAPLTGLDKQRLRWWLGLFFLALAIPTAILIVKAYHELKWETFHQYRLQAEELAARIDDRLTRLINTEEARPFTDYTFLNVAGNSTANFLQRSPLSTYPVASDIPGLIGYFQVDAQGELSTPLLPQSAVSPATYGLSEQELLQRKQLAEHIQQILSENRLVQSTTTEGGEDQGEKAKKAADREEQPLADDASPVSSSDLERVQSSAQVGFDQLNAPFASGSETQSKPSRSLGRVDELKLDKRY